MYMPDTVLLYGFRRYLEVHMPGGTGVGSWKWLHLNSDKRKGVYPWKRFCISCFGMYATCTVHVDPPPPLQTNLFFVVTCFLYTGELLFSILHFVLRTAAKPCLPCCKSAPRTYLYLFARRFIDDTNTSLLLSYSAVLSLSVFFRMLYFCFLLSCLMLSCVLLSRQPQTNPTQPNPLGMSSS